jgi:hypothetical protein
VRRWPGDRRHHRLAVARPGRICGDGCQPLGVPSLAAPRAPPVLAGEDRGPRSATDGHRTGGNSRGRGAATGPRRVDQWSRGMVIHVAVSLGGALKRGIRTHVRAPLRTD